MSMFGSSNRSMRSASGDVISMRQFARSAYSTVVVPQGCGAYLQAFSYSIGGPVSGTNGVAATVRETNLRVANQFVDEGTEWIGLGWSIPAVVPAGLVAGSGAYRVVQADVESFLQSALIRLYFGSDTPFLELVPDQHAVEHDVAGWRQRVPLPGKVPAARLEKFWLELSWPRSPPTLAGPLAVTFRLMVPSEDVEFIGKREDLDKNPKEKLYVAVGKAGLEQLLEDLMWWPPSEEHK